MSRSWSVIKFLEDQFVEAVPSSWLAGELCSWPPVATKMINALIKKCEAAEPSWPKHEVKMMTRVTFDTYLKAREKAKLAEDTSDLQSDEPSGKRRRMLPKKFWSSDDSINEVQHLDESTHTTPSCSPEEEYLEEHLDDVGEQFDVELEQQLEEIPGTSTSSFQSTPIENVAVPCCGGCKENRTQLCLLRALLVDALQEIKNLRKDVLTSRATKEHVTSIFTSCNLQFPLTTIGDIHNFEMTLNDVSQFKDAVKELAEYGGHDNYNFVKRVLTALLSNEVAVLFSWLGRKGKEDFHKLNIARLVICAAKQGKKAENDK